MPVYRLSGGMMNKSVILFIALVLGSLIFSLFLPFADADWTMFHAGPSHSGAATGSPVLTPTLLWKSAAAGGSSPVVADGVVYVGSGQNPVSPYVTLGTVYALNATSGEKLWNYTNSEWSGSIYDNGIGSTLAVVNKVVYVGSDDSNVYALNATDGSKLWNYSLGDFEGISSPIVVNDVLYVGCEDGYVYALNATSGLQLWNYTDGHAVSSSPAEANGIVYVTESDGYVYALNATNGAKIWGFSDGYFSSSSVVVNDVVYIGGNTIYALNATTGSIIWLSSYKSNVTPAIANGVLYLGYGESSFGEMSSSPPYFATVYTGTFYALNAANGQEIWKRTFNNEVYSSPAIVGDVVYFGCNDGNLYALNSNNGATIWAYPAGGGSSPAFSDGVLYFGSDDHNVYAFGVPSPLPTPTPTPTPTITPKSYNAQLIAIGGIAAFIIVVAAILLMVLKRLRTKPKSPTPSVPVSGT